MIGQLAVVKVERELNLNKAEGHAQIWKLNQTALEKNARSSECSLGHLLHYEVRRSKVC